MRKIKIYLDSSVISHLEAPDTPEKMEETLKFWDILLTDKYSVFISPVVIEEISGCDEPKRSYMLKMLSKIKYTELQPTEETANLVIEYLENKVLKTKSVKDIMHLSYAVVNDIDYIISWNFKHFVNINTIKAVNSINIDLGYDLVQIIPPVMLEGDENDEGK